MTSTYTSTYTTADIENVMRKFKADLLMIAESSAAMTTARARELAEDIQLLAKDGYIEYIDVTLQQYGVEKRAVRYTVTEQGGDLTSSRPGGVLWEQLPDAQLRIVVGETVAWTAMTATERQHLQRRLNASWTTTNADLSHSLLKSQSSRNFTSNAYGLTRKDYSL
jgi:hypothetical protein